MRDSSGIALAVACVALTAAAQILLKVGVTAVGLSDRGGSVPVLQLLRGYATSGPVIVGLLIYAASAVAWLFVLSRLELSVAVPLVSLSFVFASIYGYVALGESFSPVRIAGLLLIVSGVFVISRT